MRYGGFLHLCYHSAGENLAGLLPLGQERMQTFPVVVAVAVDKRPRLEVHLPLGCCQRLDVLVKVPLIMCEEDFLVLVLLL